VSGVIFILREMVLSVSDWQVDAVLRRTTELSDAGGPARPHRQLTWPARVRSSDFVRRKSHYFFPVSSMN